MKLVVGGRITKNRGIRAFVAIFLVRLNRLFLSYLVINWVGVLMKNICDDNFLCNVTFEVTRLVENFLIGKMTLG